MTIQVIEKTDWDWPAIHALTNSTATTTSFRKAVEVLSNTHAIAQSQAEAWIERLSLEIARLHLEDRGDAALLELLTAFVSDLAGGLRSWRVTVPIDGVWLESETLQLDPDTVLRRPKGTDFEVEVDVGSAMLRREPFSDNLPGVILEKRVRSLDQRDRESKVFADIFALTLAKVCSVNPMRLDFQPESLIDSSYSVGSQRGYISSQRVWIHKDEEDSVMRFVTAIRSMIPVYELVWGSTGPTSAGISFARYRDGLLHPEPPEARLADAVSGLEGLLLKPEERSELQHRLALRTARVCGLLLGKPLEIYHKMTAAYDFRSVHVHGGAAKGEDRPSIEALLPAILDYLRVCLVVFLQKPDPANKDRLISRLDNALLDPQALERLKEDFSKLIISPLIPQPKKGT